MKIDNQLIIKLVTYDYENGDSEIFDTKNLTVSSYEELTFEIKNYYTSKLKEGLYTIVSENGGEYIHHTHSLANMAGVVHLLLEDERDYTNIEGYETPIKEGEVVLFPSMQPHKCDPVHARKITINFNWDMHGDMEYYHPVQ